MLDLRLPALALLAGASLSAQDVLWYKFESGGGDTVLNYARGAPRVGPGKIVTMAGLPADQAWGKGRFGGGLAAAPANPRRGVEVDTGWDHEVKGSLTVGFFLRAKYALPNNSGVLLFGGNVNRSPGLGIVMGVSGIQSTFGHVTLGWRYSSSSRAATLRRDVLTAASRRWVHLAVHVDRRSPRNTVVRWYVDGVPELPQLVGHWPDIPGTSSHLSVGDRGASYFALDEFRIALRDVPAAEIKAWASTHLAAQAPFGSPCHPLGRAVLLDGTSGGPPRLGNAGYTLTVYGLPRSAVGLFLGVSNRRLGSFSLPFDLGALLPSMRGCLVRASAESVRGGVIGPTGALAFPLPIPNTAALDGAVVYGQALLASQVLGRGMLTNAWALAVGR